MLGRLNGLTLCMIGYARVVFLGNSFDAFAHKMGELVTDCCRTQKVYVHLCTQEDGCLAPAKMMPRVMSSHQTT